MTHFAESTVEEAALIWFDELGFTAKHGPHITPGELVAERTGLAKTVLAERLRDALAVLNLNMPVEGLDDAFRRVTTTHHPSLKISCVFNIGEMMSEALLTKLLSGPIRVKAIP